MPGKKQGTRPARLEGLYNCLAEIDALIKLWEQQRGPDIKLWNENEAYTISISYAEGYRAGMRKAIDVLSGVFSRNEA